MKKTNSKLQFKVNTLRVLQDKELSRAAGGMITYMCTKQAAGCFVGEESQGGGDTNGN